MGLTVLEIIERAKSEHLQPGGANAEVWDRVKTAITDTTTLILELDGRNSITIPRDGVLEFENSTMELAQVRSVTGSTVTLQSRGYLETTAGTDLTVGTRVIVDPIYPRKVLFNGLKAVLSSLRGYSLFNKTNSSSLTYSEITPVALPSGGKEVAGLIWVANGTDYLKLKRGTHWEMIHAFTPPKIRFFGGGITGRTLYFDYVKDFVQPTALTDDLDNSGISADLQPFLPMAVAAHVMLGRDIPEVDVEHVRRALENQGIPPGTRASLARNLLNSFVGGPVLAERYRLMESAPPQIVFGR